MCQRPALKIVELNQLTQFDREYIILFVISCFCVGRYVCYQLDKCIIAMSFLKHIGFSCSFSLVRYEKRRKSSCYLFKMKRIPCNVIRFITRKSIKVLRFFVIMIFLSYEELKKRLHCVYFHSKSIDQCCDPHRLQYCHCHAQQCISIDFTTPNFSFNCLCIAAIPSLCFVTCMAKLWPNKFHGSQLFFLPFLHLVTPSEIQFSWGESL